MSKRSSRYLEVELKALIVMVKITSVLLYKSEVEWGIQLYIILVILITDISILMQQRRNR